MSSDPTPDLRIGLFGGTFDPIHFGHLRSAIEMLEHFDLDKLHLIPNHRPAHRDSPRASTAQRIQMLELAVAVNSRLIVDSREARRDKASYTFDTLTEYKQDYPNASLVFFMGIDAFSGFESWYRWEEILQLANIVVVNRPGSTLSDWAETLLQNQQQNVAYKVSEAAFGVIERCDVTQLAISATQIRNACSAGRSIDYLVPEVVKQYIKQQNLYAT